MRRARWRLRQRRASRLVLPEGIPIGDGDTAKASQANTADSVKASQLAAGRDPLHSVGRRRQPQSEQQA
jgi:hypothetical protein